MSGDLSQFLDHKESKTSWIREELLLAYLFLLTILTQSQAHLAVIASTSFHLLCTCTRLSTNVPDSLAHS